MKRKPYPIVNASDGLHLNQDPLFLTDGASPNLNCVRFHKGVVKKDTGFRTFPSLTSERPMMFRIYSKWSGAVHYVLASTADLYKLGAGVWDQVRPVGAVVPTFTGDLDDNFSHTVTQDYLILTNGKDPIYKFDGVAMTLVGGLAAPDPVIYAKTVNTFYNTLVLGWTNEDGVDIPYRIRWSEVGDYETWHSGNAGYMDLLDTEDKIQTTVLLGDRLFVIKEWTIWEIFYTGGTGTNALFDKRLVNDSIGTYAPKTVISLGDKIWFFGTDNIMAFDGLNVEPVAVQVAPLLYETSETIVAHNKLNRAIAAYQDETGDYVLALPTRTDPEPNLLLKFNIRTHAVTRRTKKVSAFGYYTAASTAKTWAQAKIDATAWSDAVWDVAWRRFALPEGAPTTLYGSPDGTVEEDDRVTLSSELMVWESKDFIFSQSQRWLYFELWCKGDPFEFTFSTDSGESWAVEKTYTPQTGKYSRVRCTSEVTTDILRIRIRTSGQFEFKLPTPWYIERVRSSTT